MCGIAWSIANGEDYGTAEGRLPHRDSSGLMRGFALPALASAALLAGCGEEKPLTSEQVLTEARSLEKPIPGLYATTTKLVAFEVPGLSPEQADRIRQQMTGLTSEPQPQCLTREQAERGFEDMLREIGEGINEQQCAFTAFDADGSRVSASLSCSGAAGVRAEAKFAGTSKADAFDLTMDLEAANAMIPGGSMTMRFNVKAQRIGDCTGAETESRQSPNTSMAE